MLKAHGKGSWNGWLDFFKIRTINFWAVDDSVNGLFTSFIFLVKTITNGLVGPLGMKTATRLTLMRDTFSGSCKI